MELTQKAPNSAVYAWDLSIFYEQLGELSKELGDLLCALEPYKNTLKISEELCKQAPYSVEYSKNLSVSYFKSLEIYTYSWW
jgi:hypothetical protein